MEKKEFSGMLNVHIGKELHKKWHDFCQGRNLNKNLTIQALISFMKKTLEKETEGKA